MASSSSSSSSSSSLVSETLEYTPTWVVATVCTVIVFISLCVERLLHYLGKFLKKKKQNALYEALQKIKEELMLLGFISLLLTVFQGLISHICIQATLTSNMLPCNPEYATLEQDFHYGRKHFLSHVWHRRRLLSTGYDSDHCTSQGKVPLLSLDALHQLHIFIFVLAISHVLFSATTMLLGGAKMRKWKHWEDEIHKEDMKQEKTPNTQHHKHSHPHHEFITKRAKGTWVMSFFKQFYDSVSKSDYKALRSGFLMTHRLAQTFDFHKYMTRALEDDFRTVVGIRWYLWFFVVIFLLLNVNGWHTYFWLSFLPLILLLVVGTKLEHIITRLAQRLADVHLDHHQGPSLVKPSDHYFWFRSPGIILYLIHFILFQNAFEIAIFFWIWSTYGFHSCIMESMQYLIPRLITGVLIQVLCSYSTLPLYAIVTQMGDSYKRAIFAEHMQSTLHGWVAGVRERKRSSALSSFLQKIGIKNKKQDTSGTEIQVQSTVSQACEACGEVQQQPDAQDQVIALAVGEHQHRIP